MDFILFFERAGPEKSGDYKSLFKILSIILSAIRKLFCSANSYDDELITHCRQPLLKQLSMLISNC